ncbi:hypothetical protein NDU88_002650 [Pleurodeles waltl]|uniref:Secreted protein n=1 Tax=Pleurodeles waltl TaxID=8319 RepID=A0AAV7LER3_PLEWA|nr:hypothetical protein NDU88_002650 [Pleurodeles waltl]
MALCVALTSPLMNGGLGSEAGMTRKQGVPTVAGERSTKRGLGEKSTKDNTVRHRTIQEAPASSLRSPGSWWSKPGDHCSLVTPPCSWRSVASPGEQQWNIVLPA